MQDSRQQGRLIILVGPSGSGKTTLARGLIADQPGRRTFSVSHTTRPRRTTEIDGRDYHFVTREAFTALIGEAAFVEHAEVHGNLYGTSKAAIEEPLSAGMDVLFDVDIQGAEQLHAHFGASAHLIFIVPPRWQALVDRLVARSSESEQTLRRRLSTARFELHRVLTTIDAGVPWTCLVNDDLDDALAELRSMVCRPIVPVTPTERSLLDALLKDAEADPLSRPSQVAETP